MSGRKRKQKPPERFNEEKRTKMTWNMLDMANVANGACDQSSTTSCIYSPRSPVASETLITPRGLNSRKRGKQQAGDRNRNIELNLENSYSQNSVCQLGQFNISLSTSKTQEEELNGASFSDLTDDLWSTDCHPCVIVKLSFEPHCPLTENMDLSGLNNGCLKQVSFRAAVPTVSSEKLDALVYLQNKGVTSLVLKPEQRILKDCWTVVVCLNESALTKLPFASADVTNRKTDKMMKVLMQWFCEFPVKNDLVSQHYNIPVMDRGFDELYDAIKSARERTCLSDSVTQAVAELPQNSSLSDTQHCHVCDATCESRCNCNMVNNGPNGGNILDVQHPLLKPVLRGYQRRAVNWMLRREGCHAMSCHAMTCHAKDIDGMLAKGLFNG